MNRLTKRMYYDGSKLFGLRNERMSGFELIHNGGWYNKEGEKLGWGDLSQANLDRIAGELEDGELFIVLGEHDSFWETKSRGVDEFSPGKDYLGQYARWVVKKGQVLAITDDPKKAELPLRILREDFKKLL